MIQYTHNDFNAYGGHAIGIVYQKDKRTGITYAYESTAYWDKEKKQSRAKRRLIGRVDPDTNEIVPTDGRGRKRSPDYDPSSDEIEDMPTTVKELKAEVRRLRAENRELLERIKILENR